MHSGPTMGNIILKGKMRKEFQILLELCTDAPENLSSACGNRHAMLTRIALAFLLLRDFTSKVGGKEFCVLSRAGTLA